MNVDTKQADQQLRGAVVLPNGTGKEQTVIVFAKGAKAEAAKAAGADVVGDDDLVQRIQDGWLDFDVAIATPDMMGQVGRLGRVLGPKNLMPNPKTGTVTMDVEKAVADSKSGKVHTVQTVTVMFMCQLVKYHLMLTNYLVTYKQSTIQSFVYVLHLLRVLTYKTYQLHQHLDQELRLTFLNSKIS